MKKSIFLLVVLVFFLSCTDREDGDWDDNIKLSEKEIQFDSGQNSVTITTEGESWWITEIVLTDGSIVDISDVDTTLKDFSITEPEFILERKGGKEILILVFENDTNSERILTVVLQAGNYFDYVKIIQSAD